MSLGALFSDYEASIKELFYRVASELGLSETTLEMLDSDNPLLFRCIPSKKTVRIEWRGIASLWAMSQAVGRIAPAMFAARRAGLARLDIPNSDAQLGLEFPEFAKQLCTKQTWRWNTYFSKPDRKPNSEAAQQGEAFFWLILEWIIRHELAHIALRHLDTGWTSAENRAQELEADHHANTGLKRGKVIDHQRAMGDKPNTTELQLERDAVAAGMGLIWVSICEDMHGGPEESYPDIADRLFRSLATYNLADDSFAAEIISDFIKTLIDPQSHWPHFGSASAQDALANASDQLNNYIRRARKPTTHCEPTEGQ